MIGTLALTCLVLSCRFGFSSVSLERARKEAKLALLHLPNSPNLAFLPMNILAPIHWLNIIPLGLSEYAPGMIHDDSW